MRPRIACLALLSICLQGCSLLWPKEPETKEISFKVTSEPQGADVEYRLMLMPDEGPMLPKEITWRYLGRTPLEDSIKVPKAFLSQPRSKLQFRVRLKDYHAWVEDVPQTSIDYNRGIVLRTALRSQLLPEE